MKLKESLAPAYVLGTTPGGNRERLAFIAGWDAAVEKCADLARTKSEDTDGVLTISVDKESILAAKDVTV